MTTLSRKTSFSLGLPFSPLFEYRSDLSNVKTPGPKPITNITTADHPTQQVTIQNFSFVTKFSYSWNWNLFTWSATLALGSIVLLILARRQRRRLEAIAKPAEVGEIS